MLMTRSLAAVSALMFVGLAAPAAADKVDDAIGAAAKAYKEKSYATAIQELQYAVTKINGLLSKAYGATFPDPPAGWTARPPKSQATGVIRMQGQVISRRYREQGGRGRINAQMIVDNPLLQSYATLMANPAYARQAGYDRVKIEGVSEPAMGKFDEERGRGEILFLAAGRVLIKLDGRGLKSAAVLEDMIKRWKIADAKKIAGIK